MNKGQIFSIDFIIALIIVVLFLGITINAMEIRTIHEKERVLSENNLSRANSALNILINGKYSCKLENGLELTASLNETALSTDTKESIKSYLGVSEKNVNLEIDNGASVLDDLIEGEKIVNLEREILICNSTISFSDLNACMSSENCLLGKKKIVLGVSE